MTRADGTSILIDNLPAEYDATFQAAWLAFDPGLAPLVAWWRRAAVVSAVCRDAERVERSGR